jgi:tRNA nucleotidyltransferase/poly(A) polymerase
VTERFRFGAFWLHGGPITRLFDALETVGEARVVGGAVRNSLLGEPLGDIDIATDATPDAVARAAADAGLKVHETGVEHGTLTVVADGQPFEVTTLREDVTTDGRRATVRFTTDWARDAARRDFTMNALYATRDGVGYDYVGGLADCMNRRVRFIGEPDRRILEDHLRILRFFRFHAAYGAGELDPAGLEACRAHKALLTELAVERVQTELMRLLAAKGGPGVMSVLADEEFLSPFLASPLDVRTYRALAEVEAASGREPSPVLALAALLGRDDQRFAAAADRLRLSRKQRARGLDALAAAREMPPRSVPHVRSLLYDHGAEAFSDGLMLAVASGVDVIDLPHLLADARRWQRPRFPVSGHDLISQGGPGGPAIGERLQRLETIWRDADFSLDKASLLALDREHLEKDA